MKSAEVPEEIRDATARYAAEVQARFPDVVIKTRFAPASYVDSGVTVLCSSEKERERVMKVASRLGVRYYMKEEVCIEGWAYLSGEYAWPPYFPTAEEQELFSKIKRAEVRKEVPDATARFAAEVEGRFPEVVIKTRFNPAPYIDSGVTALCASARERERVMKVASRLGVTYYMKERVFIEGWAYSPGEYPWPHNFPEEDEIREITAEIRDATAQYAAEVQAQFPNVAVNTRFLPIPAKDSCVSVKCSSLDELENVYRLAGKLTKHYEEQGISIETRAYLPGENPWPSDYPREDEQT